MGTRTNRIEARVAPERADRIRHAAELVHQSVSSFVIDAAEEKAERIILDQRETTVPSSFFDELLAALDEPATAVPALQEAAERAGRFVTPR
jgi:uncharacterized protein (DUF1778 family)